MSTYREAILHARSGGTAYCAGKEIRFLTFKEAEPIILEQCPSRATRIDKKTGRPLIIDSKIVVDTFAEPSFDTKKLGLYDVSQNPPIPLRPTDEDIVAVWQINSEVGSTEPTVIAPEAVDEALHETIPETLGELDEEPL